MNEQELKNFYLDKYESFEELSKIIVSKIYNEMERLDCLNYLKMPITSRVKDFNSLVEKVIYRKKYTDPLNQISDLVGVRIVVLTYDELNKIVEILTTLFKEDVSIDRHYEKERSNQPYFFDYQSVHLVLRFKTFFSEELDLSNIPCEIQVRTILQHAYAELTHDLIYKSEIKINQETKRKASRSMALIESTDCLFIETKKEVEELYKIKNSIEKLTEKYFKLCGFNLQNNSRLNLLIYENLYNEISNIEQETLEHYFVVNIDNLKNQATLISNLDKTLFRQSMILLVYYLLDNNKISWLQENWMLDSEILDTICTNLGYAI